MTISTTTSRQSYNGNGVTTIFAVPFRFFANGDLVVQLVTISTGASTTLTLTTHYTVTGADDEDGGSLTMLTAPAVGERLVIRRVIAATQEVDYVDGSSFPAETHEQALDRLTMLSQQNDEVQDRSLTVPVADAAFDTELPPISAAKYLRVNAAGDKFELVSAVDVGTLVVSPFIETLLDDADQAAARVTLGVADNIFSPVEVYAVKSSDQSTSSTTGVSAAFGTEVFDNASAFSGGTFTAPVAGTYEVSWALYCVKDGTLGNVFMFYNTQADGTFWRFAASETNIISHTTTITLTAGQTIVPKIAVSAGSVTVYGTTSNAVRCSWLRIRRVA